MFYCCAILKVKTTFPPLCETTKRVLRTPLRLADVTAVSVAVDVIPRAGVSRELHALLHLPVRPQQGRLARRPLDVVHRGAVRPLVTSFTWVNME